MTEKTTKKKIKISRTLTCDEEIFLKFKKQCVREDVLMKPTIEKLLRDWIMAKKLRKSQKEKAAV